MRFYVSKLTIRTRNVEFSSPFLISSSASQLSGMEAEEDAGSERVATYKVGMLGASEVGKTALTAQFTTSDYICAYDASLGKSMPRSARAAFIGHIQFDSVTGKINFILCDDRNLRPRARDRLS